MSTTQSSLLKIALIDSGTEPGTWGNITNQNFENVFEGAIAGTATVNVTAGDVTLSTTAGPVANQARQMILNVIGSPGVPRNIIAPASSKVYVVVNGSNEEVVIQGAGPTTGVTVPSGSKVIVAWDGSDFVSINGAVDDVSVVSTNGFSATNNGGALTLATSVSGVIKGNGSALLAATAGTDYVAPGTATNFTAKQTFTGALNTVSSKFINALEAVTVSATAATGTINYDVTTQSVVYYTTNATGNWTINLRGNGSNSLDSLMANGEAITVTFLAAQGATAYYNSAVQIDGSSVTPVWLGGAAPSSGNTNGIDAYTYAIIKTASATFTVLGSLSRFA